MLYIILYQEGGGRVSFATIRLIIGLSLFLALGINLFIQFIRAFRQIRTKQHEKSTIHTFKCRACEETYQLNGEEAKERISIWSTKLETKTPTGQTSAVRFECPECHEKAFHERVFDTDVTGLGGNMRLQLNEEARSALVELVIKGVLPLFILMPFLQLLLP